MFYVDGDYLRGMLRRSAETVRATAVERQANGDWLFRLDDTGGEVVASLGTLGVSLTASQAVLLTRTDASGRGIGGGYVFFGFPPTAARNESLAHRYTQSNDKTGTTVSKTPDLPVVLVAGGSAVVVEIYGTGLAEGATYGHASIVDHAAQDDHGGTTRLTLTVKANGGTPAGRYSLTLPGFGSISDFFEVR